MFLPQFQASEHIRKAYDQKCSQLRHQVAQDLSPRLIDKTRAVVKDLHSRVTVAIQSVDSISKRIENMRDEELLPQLVELIQGYILISSFILSLLGGVHFGKGCKTNLIKKTCLIC